MKSVYIYKKIKLSSKYFVLISPYFNILTNMNLRALEVKKIKVLLKYNVRSKIF